MSLRAPLVGPLYHTESSPRTFASTCAWRGVHTIGKHVMKLWAVTTSEAYLTSKVSRRTAWSWSLPVVAIIYIVGASIFRTVHSLPVSYATDAIFVASMLGAARLQITTLFPDFLIASAFICVTVAYDTSMPLEAYQCSVFGAIYLPTCIFYIFALGCHSFSAVFMGVVLSAFQVTSPRSTPDIAAVMPFVVFVSVSLVVATEYCVATLFDELRVQSAIVEKLLGSATDGFCTLDVATKTVASASPQLMETFKYTTLVGKQLGDLVNADDADFRRCAQGGF